MIEEPFKGLHRPSSRLYVVFTYRRDQSRLDAINYQQITAASPNLSVGNRMQTRDKRGTDLALCCLVLRKRIWYAVGSSGDSSRRCDSGSIPSHHRLQDRQRHLVSVEVHTSIPFPKSVCVCVMILTCHAFN